MQNNTFPQGIQQYPQQQYIQPNAMYQQPMVVGSYPNIPNPNTQSINVMPNNYYPYQQGQGIDGKQMQDPNINNSGFNKLQDQTGVFIKQKLELAELVLGCEMENRYNVYALDQNGTKKGRQLFKCKEKSECCSRICLSGDCRPFQMSISTTQRGEEDDSHEPFLALDRPCKCTCWCFNRPYVRVTNVEGGRSEYLGKIVDPFNCCDMELKVYDKDDNLRYRILGSCCQLGVWCKCPCEPCQTIDFSILTASGEKVSTLQKRSPGCLKAALTDMDSFALNFPSSCTPSDKALLMSAVLFLDYRHFEKNPQQNNNQAAI